MDIYTYLKSKEIAYDRYDHKAVFTVEEAQEHVPPLPGLKLKNLFLCDRKGNHHFLVVTDAFKRVDLKALATILDVKNLRFGSPERLEKMLGVIPGAVTPLAVLNDLAHRVTLVMDLAIPENGVMQCHPLVNTATVLIKTTDMISFFHSTGHQPKFIDIAERE